MSTKRKQETAPPPISISNCQFIAESSQANENTRDAVVALARAAEANARAIERAAQALEGAKAEFGTGIRIINGQQEQ